MVYYFAYGSNMSSKRLSGRGIKHDEWFVAQYPKYKLVFNKLGSDGSGMANMEQDSTSTVFGVVFKITENEIKKLDIYEGTHGGHYEREWITVFSNSNKYDVVTYIAMKKGNNLKPTQKYLAIIIEGAKEHNLPKSYVTYLESIETMD